MIGAGPLEGGRWRPRIERGRVDTIVPGVKRAPNPSRVSCVWNMETPSGSATPVRGGGKPEVTKAQVPGGYRMPKKPMPVAERRQESERGRSALRWSFRITGRIPGRVPGRESAPTWAGEPLTKQLEPKDKLGADMVNGPEGLPPETGLDTVDWDWVSTGRTARGGTATAAANLQGDAGRRPAWCLLRADAGSAPDPAGNQRKPPACPRGLLEPYAATSGTYGSEGGSAGQPAGPTRPRSS